MAIILARIQCALTPMDLRIYNIYNFMSTQYDYCKANINNISQGSDTDLQLYCSNVIESYETINENPIVSVKNYNCQYIDNGGNTAFQNVGVKLFEKQYGKVMYVTAYNRKQVSTAFLPAITVCNQNL